MSEAWSAALFDWLVSKTVCRKEWFNQHVNNLCEEDQKQIKYRENIHIYQFRDGSRVTAMYSAKIQALLGNNYITIQTDIIENGIPLLP